MKTDDLNSIFLMDFEQRVKEQATLRQAAKVFLMKLNNTIIKLKVLKSFE
jgi:hypothetical protein